MLALVQAITLSNQAPVVQQSRLSRSRVTAQPTAGVERLRGGADGKCDVILVGCGVPKRGMGWYHGKQMLEGDCPSAKLTTVVEPWFLGQGKDSPPGQTFGVWAEEMSKAHGTKFCASLDEVSINGPTMALISGRTADNPRLLKEVIAAGCTHVYLEEPGAQKLRRRATSSPTIDHVPGPPARRRVRERPSGAVAGRRQRDVCRRSEPVFVHAAALDGHARRGPDARPRRPGRPRWPRRDGHGAERRSDGSPP